MKIVVLGGCGRQGTVITNDLLKKGFDVEVADCTSRPSAAKKSVIDLRYRSSLEKILPNYDLAVGALPSQFGQLALEMAVEIGVNYVDVSFMDEDPAQFNEEAVKKGITIIHDCGVAPGLSHLVAGRAIHLGADEIAISVGGVSKSPIENYVITWSPEDLYEEYTRPARIILDGEIKRVPALSCEWQEYIPGISNDGIIRSFYTDGLRSLLKKKDKVIKMTERTMRWPGHIEKVGDLLFDGPENFAKGLRKIYKENNEDMLAMNIFALWSKSNMMIKHMNNARIVKYGDEEMSAMARTTALACSSFAQLVATGTFNKPGVTPPEDVAVDDEAYKFILDCMLENDVRFLSDKYPFLEVK